MPTENTCSNCAHWKDPVKNPERMDFGWGVCRVIEDCGNAGADAIAIIEFFEPDNPYGPAPTLSTFHTFGCNLWSAAAAD